MKKFFSEVVIFILCAASFVALSACGKTDVKTPQDVIKEAYGDTEYKISFSSEGLDEPLEDLTRQKASPFYLRRRKSAMFSAAGFLIRNIIRNIRIICYL